MKNIMLRVIDMVNGMRGVRWTWDVVIAVYTPQEIAEMYNAIQYSKHIDRHLFIAYKRTNAIL